MEPAGTAVRRAYDANAERYASLFLNDLDHDSQTVEALASFAAGVATLPGPVLDVGCGPGSVVNHLGGVGLDVSGIDLSPGQIEQAHRAYPERSFAVGDLTALDVVDASLGGIVSRYSIIHLDPVVLGAVFAEWFRALQPGAPLFVSFFGSRSPDAHGTPFDHKVVTAYELDPATVGDLLRDVGFGRIEIVATPIPEGGRPFDHTTLLAQKRS
ncbi:MAG: class I SAM-dependent methyltransferase [Actinomycetota bacterium]